MNDPIRDYVERNVPENNISLYLKTGLTDEYWRMHYAGQAMQGVLSNQSMGGDIPYSKVVEISFGMSDAMIAQSKEVK